MEVSIAYSSRPVRELWRWLCMYLKFLGAVVVGKLADFSIFLEIGGSLRIFFVHLL
jgi:hypothetical protein